MPLPHRLAGCLFVLVWAVAPLTPPCLQAQIEYEANLPQSPARFRDHEYLISQAYEGDPDAMFWYGAEFQDTGQYDIAAKWFLDAVAKGHAVAMHNLARLYEHGNGVPKNLKRAFELNLQSAQKGWSHAQYDLAQCYDDGQGVEPNLKEAVRWCELSEKAGYGLAHAMYAWWYRYGKEFIYIDRVKAAQKYILAARHGHFHSAQQLGWMYYEGEGIMRDFQRAEKWFRLGAYDGNPKCVKDLAMFLAGCPDESYRRPEEALALIQEAIAAVGSEVNFKYFAVYGYALGNCQRWEEGIAQLETAIERIYQDTTSTVDDRQRFKSGTRILQDQFRKHIPYVEQLPVKTFYGPKLEDDDILENKAWPQAGLQSEPLRIDGLKWSEKLKAALEELPSLAGEATIFDLAAPGEFAFFVNAPVLPSKKSEVDGLLQQTESGDASAAFTLASLLLSDPVEKSRQNLGLELLQHLADLNQPDACNLLGWLHLQTRWVPRDELKALNLFLVAANQLHTDGQCSAAYAHARGFTGAVQFLESLRWYRRAASKNHVGAKVQLAQRLLFGTGTDQDLKQGVTLLKEGEARNFAPAQLRLGWLCRMGMGVEMDQARAFSLFSKAAAQGEANALVEVGRMLQDRKDGGSKLHQAAGMFLQAAKKLNYGGIRELATCYLFGQGVPVDYPRAIAWLRIGALSRQQIDQASLAMVLASCPQMKLRDPKEAIEFATKALKKLHTDNVLVGPPILQAAAVAYASDGKFSMAQELEARAGAAIRALIPQDSNFTQEHAMESDRRFKKYRQQRPFVVLPPQPKEGSSPLPEDTVLEDFDKLVQRMVSVQ